MTKVFDIYSKYYDLLYQDKDYDKEAGYVESLLRMFAPNTKSILEMGCGTGKHAKRLNYKGYEVFGIDISESMLEQAKELGVNCELGDVRSFRANKKFDAVLSLFHVVSYQAKDNDIIDYFNTAAEHLDSGGVFVFDLWYKPAVLAQVPEKRIKEMEDAEIKVIRNCTPEHFPKKSIVEVNYDIEILNKKSKEINNISEKHTMRYFSKEDIEKISKQSGIEIVHSEEWLTGNEPDESTWGVCFVGVMK